MEHRFPVADAHCDFLYAMYRYRHDIRTLSSTQTVHLPYLQAGNVTLQLFAVWVDETYKTPYLQQCMEMIDAYERMLSQSDVLVRLDSGFDPTGDKIAAALTVEGGEAIEGSLGVLRMLKKLGVCAMTLTWNSNNELAGAAMKRQSKGLSGLGREVVAEMEHIRMAVDVSHLSDQGIDDVLAMTNQPIFASHSNARKVFQSPRSLKDEHIVEIARRGGVVGVNYFHKQLTAGKRAYIRDIVPHILHMVEIGGDACCALGSDFDGMTQYPEDLPHSGAVPVLLQALLDAGLTETQVKRLAFDNLSDYILQFV